MTKKRKNIKLLALLASVAVGLSFHPAAHADDTLVYKGTATFSSKTIKEIESVTDSETQKKLRKRFNIFLIVEKGSTDKSLIIVSRNRKDKTYAVVNGPLSEEVVEFLGLNGKSENKLSIQVFPSGNLMTHVDRNMNTVDDTATTKSGHIQGRLQNVKINDETNFIAKVLRGKYWTTRSATAVNANPDPTSTPSYVHGSELTTLVESIGVKFDGKRTANYNSDTVSDTTSGIVSDLIDQGFQSGNQLFADGFESGDATAWSAGP